MCTHYKILFIRFSSLGDMVQSLSIPYVLKQFSYIIPCSHQTEALTKVHFVTKKNLAPLAKGHPYIDQIWEFDPHLGFRGLLDLIKELRKEKFTHIYDSHNQIRSWLLSWFLLSPLQGGLDFSRIWNPPRFLRKPQYRFKRFLLFKFHKNLFPQPFSGQRDLISPLGRWGLPTEIPPAPQMIVSNEAQEAIYIRWKKMTSNLDFQSFLIRKKISRHPILQEIPSYTLCVTSSAHALKCWPMEHWREFWSLHPNEVFIVVGENNHPPLNASDNVFDWRGTTDLNSVAACVLFSKLIVSNDTGILHIAEQLGKPAIAMMGPAPFGFPSRSTTQILQVVLPCRPCSKHGQGPCINKEFQKCMKDISPNLVSKSFQKMMEFSTSSLS